MKKTVKKVTKAPAAKAPARKPVKKTTFKHTPAAKAKPAAKRPVAKKPATKAVVKKATAPKSAPVAGYSVRVETGKVQTKTIVFSDKRDAESAIKRGTANGGAKVISKFPTALYKDR